MTAVTTPTTVRGIHVPTAGNAGTDLAAGLLAMAEEIAGKLTPVTRGAVSGRPGSGSTIGDLWYGSDDGVLYMWVGSWIPLSERIGGISDYAVGGDPPGDTHKLADGRQISAASYPLYAAIVGTTHGGTSANPALPDLRARTGVGPDNMGTATGAANRIPNSNRALGQNGGAERHALTDLESGVNRHGTTGDDTPEHSHSLPGVPAVNTLWGIGNDSAQAAAYVGTGIANATGGASTRHTHPLSQRNADQAHNNMQPYVVLNKIIRVA